MADGMLIVLIATLEEFIRLSWEDFDWGDNYVSFHLHLFSRGSVGIIAPRGGINIPTVFISYLYGGGILEVLPNLRDYLVFERRFLLFMWKYMIYMRWWWYRYVIPGWYCFYFITERRYKCLYGVPR